MTQYLVTLHDRESAASVPGSPEWDADLAAFAAFEEVAGDAIVTGEALEPARHGVVVRQGGDGPVVTEGPFAETAEVLGGVFVLECDDLDAVLALAARIPTASTGTLEVRPIVDQLWQPGTEVPPAPSRYLALLYGAPSDADRPGTDAWDAAVAEHGRFEERHREVLLGGAALHPPETATTVRVRDDGPQFTDGPFSETAEVLGGYYVLAAGSRAEAVEIGAAIPVGTGAVELRPLVEFDP